VGFILTRRLLLHLGQDVAHNIAWTEKEANKCFENVWQLIFFRELTCVIFCDEWELRPAQSVIHVIFHLIILGQAKQIAVLHIHQVRGLREQQKNYIRFKFRGKLFPVELTFAHLIFILELWRRSLALNSKWIFFLIFILFLYF
jgi:hypothetical protein